MRAPGGDTPVPRLRGPRRLSPVGGWGRAPRDGTGQVVASAPSWARRRVAPALAPERRPPASEGAL